MPFLTSLSILTVLARREAASWTSEQGCRREQGDGDTKGSLRVAGLREVTHCQRKPSQGLWWLFPMRGERLSLPGKQFSSKEPRSGQSPQESVLQVWEAGLRMEDGRQKGRWLGGDRRAR